MKHRQKQVSLDRFLVKLPKSEFPTCLVKSRNRKQKKPLRNCLKFSWKRTPLPTINPSPLPPSLYRHHPIMPGTPLSIGKVKFYFILYVINCFFIHVCLVLRFYMTKEPHCLIVVQWNVKVLGSFHKLLLIILFLMGKICSLLICFGTHHEFRNELTMSTKVPLYLFVCNRI